MLRTMFLSLIALFTFHCLSSASAQENTKPAPQEKPKVFITDSQSWEMSGASGGSAAGFGGAIHSGARPQTAEIIKTFGERCPEVTVNNIQEKTDYIVLLDHEGGKGYLRHRNKVAVFARVTVDSIVSKSTLSLGGSVQDACEAINSDWAAHGSAIRAAGVAAAASKALSTQPPATVALTPATPQAGKLSVVSVPDGADIEIDGSFVGNTPSDLQLPEGEHVITLEKAGFKNWDRKMKVSAGSNVHLNAELEKLQPQ